MLLLYSGNDTIAHGSQKGTTKKKSCRTKCPVIANTLHTLIGISSTAVYGNTYKCCLLYQLQHNIAWNTNTNALVNRWMTTKRVHKSLSSLSSTTFFLFFLRVLCTVKSKCLVESIFKTGSLQGLVAGFSFLQAYLNGIKVTYLVLPFFLFHVKIVLLQFKHEFREWRNGMHHSSAKNILKLRRQKRRVNKDTNTERRKESGQWYIYTYDISPSVFGLSLRWLWNYQPKISSDTLVC